MNWPAFAAAVGGAVVGVAGVVFGWLNSRGQQRHALSLAREQRRHERDLARDERVYSDVRTAYNLGLAAIRRAEWQAYRVVRDEEPPQADDVEVIPAETAAGISTFGLQPVVDAFNAAVDAVDSFHERARRSALEQQPSEEPGPTATLVDAYNELQAASQGLAKFIRQELRGDNATDSP